MRNIARRFMLGAKSKRRATSTTEDVMKRTPRTYVLTLNSPSRKALRLWTGKNIHALRYCSIKQMGHALKEMQQRVDHLQTTLARRSL